MNKLKPYDMEVGQYITVVSNNRHPGDRRFRGNVLRIVSVNLPYVLVEHTDKPFPNSPFDTRDWEFCLLNERYVKNKCKAMVEKSEQQKEEPKPFERQLGVFRLSQANRHIIDRYNFRISILTSRKEGMNMSEYGGFLEGKLPGLTFNLTYAKKLRTALDELIAKVEGAKVKK